MKKTTKKKISWVKKMNRRHPMIKMWVAFFIAGVAIGALVASQRRDANLTAEWQASTETEIARQLQMDNEITGVGDVTDIPGMKKQDKKAEEKPATPPPVPATGEEQKAPVSGGGGVVALTFDDGPGANTERLLDVLRDKGVKATFFVLGAMAERRPDVVRRTIAEGHEVGNHTMNHRNFNQIDGGAVGWEINRSREVIEGVTGVGVKYLRPPYGIVNDVVKGAAPVILWSVDPRDWKDRDANVVRQRVVGAASDGGVVLMHDIYGSTVDAVPGIIDDLRARGYEMVTLSELFTAKGWEPITGNVYNRIGG